LTALSGDPQLYGDYGEGSYCSTCGKNSARRSRADLWMMRREWGDTYHTRFYCRDHFPSDISRGGGGHPRTVHDEVTCASCFLRTPADDGECANCGALLPVRGAQ